MVDFNEAFASLEAGVVTLAKGTLSEYVKQATSEGQAALNQMKGNLELWSKQLANGDMDENDLKFLIQGRKELTEMRGLKQLGIAQIQLDKFKGGLVDLIVSTIGKIA